MQIRSERRLQGPHIDRQYKNRGEVFKGIESSQDEALPGYARPRRRSALPMTDTDDKLIARAAMSGLSSKPYSG